MDALQFYIKTKRIFYKNPFIRTPTEGNDDYDKIMRLEAIVRAMGGTFEEYLLLQINLYKKKNIFPSPAQLLGDRAIGRYKTYMKLKALRKGERFLTDTETVYIRPTGLYYTLADFTAPFEEDEKFQTVNTYIQNKADPSSLKEEEILKMYRLLEYVLAKYEYKGKTPPEVLMKYYQHVMYVKEVRDENS